MTAPANSHPRLAAATASRQATHPPLDVSPDRPGPRREQQIISRSYPGLRDQVGKARTDLAEILDSCPAADSAVQCLSEVATNTVVHSKTGKPGGHFTVQVDLRHVDYVRVSVTDDGGPWGSTNVNGYGLQIVHSIAVGVGITGDEESGHTVWFRCHRQTQ
jgi:serine/threonine-protein kinase RsbW